MATHDLRNLMTGIKGYSSILLEKLDMLEKDRQVRYLSIIRKEIDLLTRLITDLLDLQRFEAGEMTLEFHDIDLIQTVKESLDSFLGAMAEKNLILENRLPDQEALVHGHHDRLLQVMGNLLSNAIKFTPEGGRIIVGAEKVTEDGKPGVRVSVSDTGPGIPRERQSILFDKFQHLHHSMKRQKNQGTGLGLALFRNIIEHHGGRVGVESEPGRGSTFYFVLDIKSQE
jgi:signal transduction histidine kinase